MSDGIAVYSIRLFPTTPQVTATWLGLDVPRYTLKEKYDSVDDMPHWASYKLSVLYTVDHNDKPTPYIDNIGRRINSVIYWITTDKLEGVP